MNLETLFDIIDNPRKYNANLIQPTLEWISSLEHEEKKGEYVNMLVRTKQCNLTFGYGDVLNGYVAQALGSACPNNARAVCRVFVKIRGYGSRPVDIFPNWPVIGHENLKNPHEPHDLGNHPTHINDYFSHFEDRIDRKTLSLIK